MPNFCQQVLIRGGGGGGGGWRGGWWLGGGGGGGGGGGVTVCDPEEYTAPGKLALIGKLKG